MASNMSNEALALASRYLGDMFTKANDPENAFLQYSQALRLMPEWKPELKNSFSSALCLYFNSSF